VSGGASKADRMPLGGLVRHKLMREIALGDLNGVQLAEKYGVSTAAISQFKQRNAEGIKAIVADADNEFAGILIAQKVARLAAYEELHAIAITPQPKISPSGKIVKEWITDEDGNDHEVVVNEVDVRAAALVMKQAAEEMGQLPTRLQIQGDMQTTTTYRVEGVSPEDLT
jgi:hypothetical protein